MSSAAIDLHFAWIPLPRVYERTQTPLHHRGDFLHGRVTNRADGKMHGKTEQERREKGIRGRGDRGMSEDPERSPPSVGNNNRGDGRQENRIRRRKRSHVQCPFSSPTHTHTHNSVFTYHPWTYSPSSTILWHFPIKVHSNSITKPQCSQSAT